jgi:ribose transport system ATP-binding protein
VLRDGRTVGVVDVKPGAEEKIVELMLGDKIVKAEAARASEAGSDAVPRPDEAPRMRARNLEVGTKLHGVSFDLRPGEVLGLVALEGQGQDELFGVLSGSSRPSGGAVEVDGTEVRFRHPADAIAVGVVLVPGDRTEGLCMQRPVRENIALPFSARIGNWGPIRRRMETERVDEAIRRLQIDTRAQAEVQRLSGGNQQKVTIARWIATGARAVLCFDPTRGIDVGTKREIYRLLRELAAQGTSVLLYTSELEEVQLVCDRAVVIFGGRVVDTIPAVEADEPTLMRAAYGLPRGAPMPSAGTATTGASP